MSDPERNWIAEEPTQSSVNASNGCALGGIFGLFVFPILWVFALYTIPAYDEAGKQIENPGSMEAMVIMVPLAFVGAIVFGGIGALGGYIVRRIRKGRTP